MNNVAVELKQAAYCAGKQAAYCAGKQAAYCAGKQAAYCAGITQEIRPSVSIQLENMFQALGV